MMRAACTAHLILVLTAGKSRNILYLSKHHTKKTYREPTDLKARHYVVFSSHVTSFFLHCGTRNNKPGV